jgi:hypothetical protein
LGPDSGAIYSITLVYNTVSVVARDGRHYSFEHRMRDVIEAWIRYSQTGNF